MNIVNGYDLQNSFNKYILRPYSGAVNPRKEKTMNTGKPATRLSSPYPTPEELAHYELEARRLRSEFIGDFVTSLVIALDGLVRRVACGIAARLFGSDCMHA